MAIMGEKPMFQIDALLAVPDIILNPPANEIFKMTLQSIRDTLDRWVSCHRSPKHRLPSQRAGQWVGE